MTKKNMHIAISSLVLLGAASFLQAEEAAAQPEALLEYSALGTGEQIREEVLTSEVAVTNEVAARDDEPSDPDVADEDETPPPPPPQKNGKMKKKNGQNGNGRMNGRNNNGNKSSEGKCGEGTCS